MRTKDNVGRSNLVEQRQDCRIARRLSRLVGRRRSVGGERRQLRRQQRHQWQVRGVNALLGKAVAERVGRRIDCVVVELHVDCERTEHTRQLRRGTRVLGRTMMHSRSRLFVGLTRRSVGRGVGGERQQRPTTRHTRAQCVVGCGRQCGVAVQCVDVDRQRQTHCVARTQQQQMLWRHIALVVVRHTAIVVARTLR
eukprot:TRINITY_DN493_c0_g1_i1.p1 TRINITY_DN493_c0_g1~~TRINITY_DN493_c0_g1_i1.p1  ORF type:complete len:196 (+),score=102.36 TRINITY_DN493_c0_g1_i1:256-843(+)